QGAHVQVEGTDNSIYPLSETGAGIYTTNPLPLQSTVKYRLRITTKNGESYLSDTVPYRPTPAIDSINWIENGDGVTVYANTHDPSNSTLYYQWDFTETWQYTAAEFSGYIYAPKASSRGEDTVISRTEDQYIYNCWTTKSSTPLLLGTSAKLAQDVIYR